MEHVRLFTSILDVSQDGGGTVISWIFRIQDGSRQILALVKYLTLNLGLESYLIPLCMGYQGLQNHSSR